MLLTLYPLQNAYDLIKAYRTWTRMWDLKNKCKSKMLNGLSNFAVFLALLNKVNFDWLFLMFMQSV